MGRTPLPPEKRITKRVAIGFTESEYAELVSACPGTNPEKLNLAKSIKETVLKVIRDYRAAQTVSQSVPKLTADTPAGDVHIAED